MFSLVGFYDATAHAALAEVDAIPDPHVRVAGNDIYVPSWNKIMAVFATGGAMTECRLQSPSLRRLSNQRIAPVGDAAWPAMFPTPMVFHDYRKNPRTLDIAEALNAFAVNGGATAEWVLVWLMDKVEALPAGEIFTTQGTTAVTGVLANWVNGALTFTETLPAGRYALVGMRSEDTAVVAARCVFPDIATRPGCLGQYDADTPDERLFRQGEWGNWGEFEHDAPPTIDHLCNANGAVTPEIIMDLIQVRAGRK